jgi:hypothetical protein
MWIPRCLTRCRQVSFGVLLAGCLVLGSAKPATASVVYDFSLAANGDVGAIAIQLTFGDFLPVSGLAVFDLGAPEVTAFSSGTPIDPTSSFVGMDVMAAGTLFGFRLSSVVGEVLTTLDFPVDFFAFDRTVTQTGTASSTTGTVFSDLALATTTPPATLMVSTRVPEPATFALLGLAAAGALTWHRHRRRTRHR